MPDTPTRTPAARRQRRHRARRKQGRFVVPVEVSSEMLQALVDQGDVDEANSSDLDYVGKAITAAARRGLDLTEAECPLLGVKQTSISSDWMSACPPKADETEGSPRSPQLTRLGHCAR